MNNTQHYWGGKKGVAQYVADLLLTLKPTSVLTMTIAPVWLGGSYVFTVIDGSLEDIEEIKERSSYWTRTTTLSQTTLAG